MRKNITSVGLDIGSSKIAAVIIEIDDDGKAQIAGTGIAPSQGIKNGLVVNIESCVASIHRAIEGAELMAGSSEIHAVHAAVSGDFISSRNSHGVVPVRGGEVLASDVRAVIEAAQAVSVPSDRHLLHVLPQSFSVDEQSSISNPTGMAATRLEADVHLVTCTSSILHNIEKCIERANLEPASVSLEQWALSESVLTSQDKSMGVCLVDIGADTTDIAIFTEGALRFCTSLNIAGEHITNDIALAMRSNSAVAEKIKIEYGKALAQISSDNVEINLPEGTHKFSSTFTERMLAEVIEPRYEELLMKVQKVLRNSDYEDDISLGVVVCGGGSKIPGLLDLAEDIFHMPVRIGLPHDIKGQSSFTVDPVYSCAIALAQQGLKQPEHIKEAPAGSRAHPTPDGGVSRLKNWIVNNM